MCISKIVIGRVLLYKSFKCVKNLNDIYIFIWVQEGGALMHVSVWEHIVGLYYRTDGWMFMKLVRDEVPMAKHMH